MLHPARCHHIYPPDEARRHTTYRKACAGDAELLETWALAELGQVVRRCDRFERVSDRSDRRS